MAKETVPKLEGASDSTEYVMLKDKKHFHRRDEVYGKTKKQSESLTQT